MHCCLCRYHVSPLLFSYSLFFLLNLISPQNRYTNDDSTNFVGTFGTCTYYSTNCTNIFQSTITPNATCTCQIECANSTNQTCSLVCGSSQNITCGAYENCTSLKAQYCSNCSYSLDYCVYPTTTSSTVFSVLSGNCSCECDSLALGGCLNSIDISDLTNTSSIFFSIILFAFTYQFQFQFLFFFSLFSFLFSLSLMRSLLLSLNTLYFMTLLHTYLA
jgi:hypothetical protein